MAELIIPVTGSKGAASRVEPRPRIGVDFHAFDGIYQGSRSRLLGIFSHLLGLAEEFDFVLFTGETEGLRSVLPAVDPARVQFCELRSKGPLGRLLLELPRLAKRLEIDLFHSQYILPVGLSCQRVVTVHDVLFESHPEFFTRNFVRRSRILTRRSARVADHVITVSEFSAREIRRRYGVGADRITVSYDAVDESRFSAGALDAERLRARGLEPGEYLLSVGRVDSRKNFGTLIEAYAGLDCTMPLVIVGQVANEQAARVLKWRDPEGTRRIVHLTDVDDQELPSLYAGAAVFAFVSYAEGFGMPLIEAMAAGTPVLASDRTSMPEVVGNAARLVNPERTGEIRAALAELLTDEAMRERLKSRGLERIKAFSWRNEANKLREIYNRVLAEAAVR